MENLLETDSDQIDIMLLFIQKLEYKYFTQIMFDNMFKLTCLNSEQQNKIYKEIKNIMEETATIFPKTEHLESILQK